MGDLGAMTKRKSTVTRDQQVMPIGDQGHWSMCDEIYGDTITLSTSVKSHAISPALQNSYNIENWIAQNYTGRSFARP